MIARLPSAVYTAVRGYAWSKRPEGIPDQQLDALLAASMGTRGDFVADGIITKGVASICGMAAAFTIQRAHAWDSEGRDADYAAFAFIPADRCTDVDFADLLNDDFFKTPSRMPPDMLDYKGPSSTPPPLNAAGKLLCHNRLESFDAHAIGALLAAHAAHCDRWIFRFADNSPSDEASVSVQTSPWHR